MQCNVQSAHSSPAHAAMRRKRPISAVLLLLVAHFSQHALAERRIGAPKVVQNATRAPLSQGPQQKQRLYASTHSASQARIEGYIGPKPAVEHRYDEHRPPGHQPAPRQQGFEGEQQHHWGDGDAFDRRHKNSPDSEVSDRHEKLQYLHPGRQGQEPGDVPPPGRWGQPKGDVCHDKEANCPTPQHADDVKQAYIAHGSFTWRELARDSEDRRASKAKLMTQAGANHQLNQQQQHKSRPQHVDQAVLQQLAKQQSQLLNAQQQQQQQQLTEADKDLAEPPASQQGGGPEVATVPPPLQQPEQPARQGLLLPPVQQQLQQGVPPVQEQQPQQQPPAQQVPQTDSNAQQQQEQEQHGWDVVVMEQEVTTQRQVEPQAQQQLEPQAQLQLGQQQQQQPEVQQQQQQQPPQPTRAVKKKQAWPRPASRRSAAAVKPADAVSVASVDAAKHLLPTSSDETGFGFHGVRAQYLPSDQAVAVGPHPVDPDGVMVIQGAQGSFVVNMVMLDSGRPVESVTNNLIFMDDMMAATGIATDNLYGLNPSAWYDPKERRYVLMWASGMIYDGSQHSRPTEAFPLFIAVSASNNPLGDWTVWALDTVPQIAPGCRFCAGQDLSEYAANTPQGTFTDDAIIISMGVFCGRFDQDDDQRAFLSVMYAYSKAALYAKPTEHRVDIFAATYFGATSWYHSVPLSGQALVEERFKPFNDYIQPARPQEAMDVSRPPMLVMKVSDNMISVATLVGGDLDRMTSIDNAPRILATLVGKGGDFSNPGQPEGLPVMPQPDTHRTLDAGDVGTNGRNHEGRVYWATQHKGLVYLTTSEFWGSGDLRMPSAYWAVVEPAPGLCSVSRLEWGVVASQEGLAVAYPVITARRDGRAALAFAYSGAGRVCEEQFPAYPGVATATVGQGHGYGARPDGPPVMQVVKRGPGAIDRPDLGEPQDWGTYSAAQVWDGKMWFAVVMPEAVGPSSSGGQLKHGSWISAVDL